MKKQADDRAPTGPALLCMEICLDRPLHPDQLCAVFSIVGRESTLTLRWPLRGGRIDAKVLADCLAALDRQVTLSVETMIGVQEVLPLA